MDEVIKCQITNGLGLENMQNMASVYMHACSAKTGGEHLKILGKDAIASFVHIP